MDRIVTINHLCAFIGRHETESHGSVEQKMGWDVEGSFLEKIPILALRNRDMENESPLSWKPGRNLDHAVILALNRLKGWQAYRPANAEKIAHEVESVLPGLLKSLQRRLIQNRAESLWEIMKLDQKEYEKVLTLIAETVGDLSSFKSDLYPMFGSKLMHLFLPEFFPIWDTAWIKKRCLANEPKDLGRRLPPEVALRLKLHSKASFEYGWYFALMLCDLEKTGERAYRKIEEALIRHSNIPREVIDFHFFDISPIVFEFCLLGKHLGC